MTVLPVPHMGESPPTPRRRPGVSRPWPWHQLPVHSPLGFDTAWRGVQAGFRAGHDSRPRVRSLVRVLYQGDEALLVGSGTQALTLAMSAAARVRGEADGSSVVALPAYGCYDIATAAVAANAKILLYDLNPATLAPDLESVTATLAEGAGVIVIAPLYGIPVDWAAIEQCVKAFGALAIEDAAQGHGAAWRDRPLGSLGRLSVLSFGRGKGWTAGEGGALLARDDAHVPERLPRQPGSVGELRVAVRALAQSLLGRPEMYGLPTALPWLHLGETRYHDPEEPREMSRTAAALLERTLPLATREAELRRANALALLECVEACARVRPIAPPPGATPGYLRLPLRVAQGINGFADPGAARRAGAAPGYPTTLAELPAVQRRLVRARRWRGAEELVRELVTLPTHSLLGDEDQRTLVRLLEVRE
ncbi:MAG TPA: DegT/DnrJ/EryC1/StrS family aminotransferase [Gemmatimonadales bacterium]|nr:DegT/DnrJ/EryC1/StrS family aminotransferase [Gemmatimonadales bacterium]